MAVAVLVCIHQLIVSLSSRLFTYMSSLFALSQEDDFVAANKKRRESGGKCHAWTVGKNSSFFFIGNLKPSVLCSRAGSTTDPTMQQNPYHPPQNVFANSHPYGMHMNQNPYHPPLRQCPTLR